MTEEQIRDLKDFITTVVRQEMTSQTGELHREFTLLSNRFDGLEQRFDGLEQRFDGLDQRFDGLEQRVTDVEDKVDTVLEVLGERTIAQDDRLMDHEVRITRLETKPT